LDRVFHRVQGTVGGVREGTREIGPQAGLVLAGQQEAPEAEAQLRNDLPARDDHAAPPSALLGLGDVAAGLAAEWNLPVGVPLGGAAPTLLAGNEPRVQR